MNHVARATVVAFKTHRRLSGLDVQFACDVGEIARLRVVKGRAAMQHDDQQGLERWEAADFLALASELSFEDERYEPVRGDRLTHCGRIYVCLTDDAEGPCFSYDATREILRIHTKYVDDAETP